MLENQLSNPVVLFHESGGQGVTAGDQVVMSAGELFRRMDLGEPEKSRALALLQSWGAKTGRIFSRMLLLLRSVIALMRSIAEADFGFAEF